MKIKCLIIDDEPLAIRLLEDYISKTYFLEFRFSTVNPLIGLQKMKEESYDLVFLDIQMPELSGVNFMKIVGNKMKYILTTAYAEYALEGYEHNVIDYLLKPVSFDRFQKSALKALERFPVEDSQNTHFFIKSSGQQHRINFNDIFYIESIKDYVNIKTINQEYIVLETLKSLESQLPDNFIRVHKSYIVNINKIKSILQKIIILNSEKEIPIGDSYKYAFMEKLK